MKTLLKALAESKKEIGKISKETTNPFYKSKYFDINALLEHVEPILEKNGLMVLQPIKENKVYSTIIHVESGEELSSFVELISNPDPQKLGSAITYFRRYTLQSLLALQAEDDDGNKASKPQAPQKKAKPYLNVDTEEWSKAVEYLKKGGNISDIQKKYKISDTGREMLMEQSI